MLMFLTKFSYTLLGVQAGLKNFDRVGQTSFPVLKGKPWRENVYRFVIGCVLLYSVALAQNAPDLTFTVTEKGLSGPTTVGNGFQKIVIINNSAAEVDFTFFKLRDGATQEQFVAADKAFAASFSGPDMAKLIALADAVGGGRPTAGRGASIYIKLVPGNYVVSAASGSGGDYKPFYMSVAVMKTHSAPAPKADFVLKMKDFHFDFPQAMKAGEQLWQVSNTGSQPHVAVIFKLVEGKTAKDVIAWLDKNAGPPPFDTNVGIFLPAVTAGQTYYMPVNLNPGTYAALCPLPNLAGAKPHHADGMVSTFIVK